MSASAFPEDSASVMLQGAASTMPQGSASALAEKPWRLVPSLALDLHMPPGPFDAKVACYFPLGADGVVTTPNQDWIPEFPMVIGTYITTRTDGKWGQHQYSRWPQTFHPHIPHHLFIPREPSAEVVGHIMWTAIGVTDWEEDKLAGVRGLGFLNAGILAQLAQEAQKVIEHFQMCGRHLKSSRDHKVHGYNIILVLRQYLDRLRVLTKAVEYVVALASHIQRLTLELAGYITYVDIGIPRIDNPKFVARHALKVQGAFTTNAASAQTMLHIGVPYWFIQPLTRHICIWKVVQPHNISAELSLQEAVPKYMCVCGDPSYWCSGPADWPQTMVLEALQHVCGAELAELAEQGKEPRAVRMNEVTPHGDNDRPEKRVRIELEPVASTSAAQQSIALRDRTAKRSHQGRHSRKEPGANEPPPPPAHPALQYRPLAVIGIPPCWHEALRKMPILPPLEDGAVYFYPPPFLFDGEGEKTARYIHNYARICRFLHLRLLDPTLGGKPLKIAEWRDALYGDYTLYDETSKTDKREWQQSTRRLFAKTAAIRSYDSLDAPSCLGYIVTADITKTSIDLRRRIVVECCEINWRCELLSLDGHFVGYKNLSYIQHWMREHNVAKVWGLRTAVSVVPERVKKPQRWMSPPPEEGWESFRPVVYALLRTMEHWCDRPAELTAIDPEVLRECDGDEYARIQRAVAEFYVKSFVHYYHRLPIVPPGMRADMCVD